MRLIDADAEIALIEQEIQRIKEKAERIKGIIEKEPLNAADGFAKELEQCCRNEIECKAKVAALRNYRTVYNTGNVIRDLRAREKYLMEGFVLADISYEGKKIALACINEIDAIIKTIKLGHEWGGRTDVEGRAFGSS